MAGHITRRKYGNGAVKWRARLPDPSRGGTAQIERTFGTRREAEEWLDELRHSARSGQFIDPRLRLTLAGVADEWRATWGKLKPRTKAGYDAILEKHVLPRWGKAKVNAITADKIQTWVNQLAADREPQTVANIYAVLRNLMALAERRRYIAGNPCEAVELPRRRARKKGEPVKPKRQIFLTPEEVRRLADELPRRYRLPLYIAAYCGLRAGELWALRRNDVDLLRGTIRVDEQLQEVNSQSEWLTDDERGQVYAEPKTDESKRTVAVPEFIRAMLGEHLASNLPAGPEEDALIFPTPNGLPMRHNLFYSRKFRPAVGRVFPSDDPKHRLRWHDLRHTCASLSLAVTPNLHLVKERLGHRDIRTTINHYGHLLPSVDQALAAGLDDLWSGSEPQTAQGGKVRELHSGR